MHARAHAGAPAPSDVPDLLTTTERTILDLRGGSPFVSLGHYRYLSARDPLPRQTHSHLFIVAFAIRSRFEFLIDDEIAPVGPGETILIRPGEVYRTGADAQTRGELIWLVMTARTTAETAANWAPVRGAIRGLLDGTDRVLRTPPLCTTLLHHILTDRDRSQEVDTAWRESLCAAAIAEQWHSISRGASAMPDPVHPGIARAVRWAGDHLEESITANDLVERSGLSTTRFHELFVQSFGTGAKDYILRAKIDRAAELLRQTSIPVTDIAHGLGFSSGQHFSTAFRRYFATSPTAFRRGADAASAPDDAAGTSPR